MNNVAKVHTLADKGEGILLSGDGPVPAKFRAKPVLPVVLGLRPKQVRAAMMLVEGRMAKEVAGHLHVSPETVSRWRAQPAFQLLMGELLQDSIEATKLGLVSLCSESVMHLRGLVRAFDDKTALKAINLLLTKVGPVLTAISGQMQQPVAKRSEEYARRRHLRADWSSDRQREEQ